MKTLDIRVKPKEGDIRRAKFVILMNEGETLSVTDRDTYAELVVQVPDRYLDALVDALIGQSFHIRTRTRKEVA